MDNRKPKVLRYLVKPSDPTSFKDAFNSLTKEEKKLFENKILDNKFSNHFLRYIKNNSLLNLFNKNFLDKAFIQSKRFKIQSMEISQEMQKINELFLDSGFDPVFLKGAALLADLKDFSVRSTTDIDILLPKDQLYDAYKLLIQNHYEEYHKTKGVRDKENIELLTKFSHQIPALRSKKNILIDLHHRVTRPADFKKCPISHFFLLNKRKINFCGKDIFIPSHNELFLHTIINLSLNNRFHNSLRSFEDIKKINAKNEINLQEISLMINNKKLHNASSLALWLLRDLSLLTEKQNKFLLEEENFSIKKSILYHAERVAFSLDKYKANQLVRNKLKKSSNPYEYLKTVLSRIFITKYEIAYLYKTSSFNPVFICYVYVRNIFVKGSEFIKKLFNSSGLKQQSHEIDDNTIKIERWFNE